MKDKDLLLGFFSFVIVLIGVLKWQERGIHHRSSIDDLCEIKIESDTVQELHFYTLVSGKYDIEFSIKGTQYQPVPEQCDSDPLVTANMTKVDLEKLKSGKQKICAFSNDIIEAYGLKMGEKFDVYNGSNFLGTYIFCDKMNPRIYGTMDIMIHPEHIPRSYKNLKVQRHRREG